MHACVALHIYHYLRPSRFLKAIHPVLLDGKDIEPVIQPASREAPAATAADEDEAKRQEQDYKKDEMSGRRAGRSREEEGEMAEERPIKHFLHMQRCIW